MYGPVIDQLIEALRCLPGVGPKSAQRMALHLLERDPQGGLQLAQSISQAVDKIGHCSQCRTLTEKVTCDICTNPSRNQQQLCVVETPADMFAIESTSSYRGRYFVLMGHLSPIDGIGPEDIGIDTLINRLTEQPIEELILATNLTVEGEATAFYISEQAKKLSIQVSRIAHGVPMGGELEFVDGGTLSHAFSSRHSL